MLLHVVARGRIGRGPEAELVDRYLKRVGWPVRVTELPDTGGKLPAVDPGTRIVLLDEKGDQPGSMAFAEKLGRWRDDGVREVRFMLGAADGFGDAERAGADWLIAFGRMTWPHLMARAMPWQPCARARWWWCCPIVTSRRPRYPCPSCLRPVPCTMP